MYLTENIKKHEIQVKHSDPLKSNFSKGYLQGIRFMKSKNVSIRSKKSSITAISKEVKEVQSLKKRVPRTEHETNKGIISAVSDYKKHMNRYGYSMFGQKLKKRGN